MVHSSSTAVFLLFIAGLFVVNVKTTHEGEEHQLDEIFVYNTEFEDVPPSCSSDSKASIGGFIASHSSYHQWDLIVNNPTNCTYTLELPDGYNHMMLEFTFFDIDVRFTSDPDKCDSAYMDIFDGEDTIIGSKLCQGLRPPLDGDRYYTSTFGNGLKIHLYTSGNVTSPKSVVVNFHAYFTAFNLVSEYLPEEIIGNCTEKDFDCESSDRCVPFEVTCDLGDIPNCGISDASDESTNKPLECPVIVQEEIDLTPLWVVLGLFGVLGPFIFYWCCWKPGYIPWWCAHCRRNDCCPNLCSCCTKKSRHLCRVLCMVPGLRGCPCVCCSSKTGVAEEKEKLRVIDTESPTSDERKSRQQKNLGSRLSQNSSSSGGIRLSNVTIVGGQQGGTGGGVKNEDENKNNRPEYQGRNSKNYNSPDSSKSSTQPPSSIPAVPVSSNTPFLLGNPRDDSLPSRSQQPRTSEGPDRQRPGGQPRATNGPAEGNFRPSNEGSASPLHPTMMASPKNGNPSYSSPYKDGYRPLDEPSPNQPKLPNQKGVASPGPGPGLGPGPGANADPWPDNTEPSPNQPKLPNQKGVASPGPGPGANANPWPNNTSATIPNSPPYSPGNNFPRPEGQDGTPTGDNSFPNPNLNHSPPGPSTTNSQKPGVYLSAPAQVLAADQDTSGYHVREGR